MINTVKDLSSAEIKALPFDELLTRLEPFIESKVRKSFLFWMDKEDVRQEIHLVAYKAQQQYNPEERDGPKAQFFSYFYSAVNRRLATLFNKNKKYHYSPASFECEKCGASKAIGTSTKTSVCTVCSGRRWTYTLSNQVFPLESFGTYPDNQDTMYHSELPLGKSDEYPLEDSNIIETVVNLLPVKYRDKAMYAVNNNHALTPTMKRILQRELRKNNIKIKE